MPSIKSAIWKVEMLAEKYVLLDSLLFELVTTPKRDSTISNTWHLCQQDNNIISF